MGLDRYNLEDMELIHDIALGFIQGITEFIPVSSSGHLVIGQYFFQGSSDHLFLEWINIGTLLALLVYFRSRLVDLALDIVQNRNYRLARNIIITSLPAVIVGFFAADFIAGTSFFESIYTVLSALVLVGILMICIDRLPKASPVEDGGQLSVLRAFFIGVIQVFAFIPGVSRSGSTIIAGRLIGLSAEKSAEYSFLAAIPIMIGVSVKLLLGSDDRAYLMENVALLAVGNTVAFISGLIAIGFLLRYLSSHSLVIFGWYRIVFAAVVTLVLLVQ